MNIQKFGRLFLCMAASMLTWAACSDEEPENSSNNISIPPESQEYFEKGMDFTSEAENKTLTFTATKDWKVTAAATRSGEQWYRIHPLSGGPGEARVTFEVDGNEGYDDRSVAVTIDAGGFTKTMMIMQKQKDALLLTSDRLEVKQDGETVTVGVKANIKYQVVIPETCRGWIQQAASTRALTENTLQFRIAKNEETEKREGSIIFTDGTLTETVKVYQAGGNIILLTSNLYPVSDKGETITVELKSNCEYGVKMPDVSWMKETVITRGMSSHTLYYTVSTNTEVEPRQAKIIYFDKSNPDIADTLTVKQAQRDAVVISEKNHRAKAEGEVLAIDVSSNVDLTLAVPDTCGWLSETSAVTRALQPHKIYIKAAANEDFAPRRAVVLVKSKGSNVCDTVRILQAGKETNVALAQTELTVPKEGGTYRVKIQSDVPVAFDKWDELDFDDDYIQTLPDDMVSDDNVFTTAFYYVNNGTLTFSKSLEADELIVTVEKALFRDSQTREVVLYAKYDNKEVKLIIHQEGDASMKRELRLGDSGKAYMGGLYNQSLQLLTNMYTMEDCYTLGDPSFQGYNNYSDFIRRALTPNTYGLDNTYNACYQQLRRIKVLEEKLDELNLYPEDVNGVGALLNMQALMVYNEMINWWGNVPFMDHLPVDLSAIYFPQLSGKELYDRFDVALETCIKYLPDAMVQYDNDATSMLFPSNDIPRFLMARTCMYRKNYEKAKELLHTIVQSGRYAMSDQLYAFKPEAGDSRAIPVTLQNVQNVCYSYVEVLLALAECEYRTGNQGRAEEYLEKVSTANAGTPAYGGNGGWSDGDVNIDTRAADDFVIRLASVWQNQLKGTGTYFAFLKRNGLGESVLNIPAYRLLFPIPQRAIETDPTLIQNPEY